MSYISSSRKQLKTKTPEDVNKKAKQIDKSSKPCD